MVINVSTIHIIAWFIRSTEVSSDCLLLKFLSSDLYVHCSYLSNAYFSIAYANFSAPNKLSTLLTWPTFSFTLTLSIINSHGKQQILSAILSKLWKALHVFVLTNRIQVPISTESIWCLIDPWLIYTLYSRIRLHRVSKESSMLFSYFGFNFQIWHKFLVMPFLIVLSG